MARVDNFIGIIKNMPTMGTVLEIEPSKFFETYENTINNNVKIVGININHETKKIELVVL